MYIKDHRILACGQMMHAGGTKIVIWLKLRNQFLAVALFRKSCDLE